MPCAGLWAGLILGSSPLFVTSGHMAKADTPLTFFSTFAVLIFVYGTFRRPDEQSDKPAQVVSFPQSWPIVALLYAAVGVAALAKGLPRPLAAPGGDRPVPADRSLAGRDRRQIVAKSSARIGTAVRAATLFCARSG